MSEIVGYECQKQLLTLLVQALQRANACFNIIISKQFLDISSYAYSFAVLNQPAYRLQSAEILFSYCAKFKY